MKKKVQVRYVMVDDGYNLAEAQAAAASEAGTEDETETEIVDETDLRLECLKLAVTFAKTKDQSPIPVAREFVDFVLAKEPPATTGEAPSPDGRTRP